MKRIMGRSVWLVLLVVMAAAAYGAPNDKTVQSAPAEVRPLNVVRDQINSLLQEREDMVRELNARYTNAALDQRTALEAEMAQMQAGYDLRFLELLVEYHQLSGNAAELERAERMLEAMTADPQEATPLQLDRNLQLETAPATSEPRDGGVVDAQ